MSDELERVLGQTREWEPPPADPDGVKVRGGKLRRRRIATAIGSSLAGLIILGIGGALFLDQRDERPQPAILHPDRRDPEQIGKVARFALHAVLELGPYELDYKTTETTEDGWRSVFVTGDPVAELEERLRIRRDTVEQFETRLEMLKRRIETEMEGRSRAKVLRQLRNDLRRMTEFSLPAALDDLRTVRRQLEETRAEGGPHEVIVEVSENDGTFEVTRFTGPYDETQTAEVESFTEEVPETAVGYEPFGEPLRVEDIRDGISWDTQVFYVGPIPRDAYLTCELTLRDANGEPVAVTPKGRSFPLEPAPSEDRRDQAAVAGPLELLVEELPPHEGLTQEMKCREIPRGTPEGPGTVAAQRDAVEGAPAPGWELRVWDGMQEICWELRVSESGGAQELTCSSRAEGGGDPLGEVAITPAGGGFFLHGHVRGDAESVSVQSRSGAVGAVTTITPPDDVSVPGRYFVAFMPDDDIEKIVVTNGAGEEIYSGEVPGN